MIAVVVPGNLFGFAGEIEVALPLIFGNEIVDVGELKEERRWCSVSDVVRGVERSYRFQIGIVFFWRGDIALISNCRFCTGSHNLGDGIKSGHQNICFDTVFKANEWASKG